MGSSKTVAGGPSAPSGASAGGLTATRTAAAAAALRPRPVPEAGLTELTKEENPETGMFIRSGLRVTELEAILPWTTWLSVPLEKGDPEGLAEGGRSTGSAITTLPSESRVLACPSGERPVGSGVQGQIEGLVGVGVGVGRGGMESGSLVFTAGFSGFQAGPGCLLGRSLQSG